MLVRLKDEALGATPDLNRILATLHWGDEVAAVIERDGVPQELTLTFQR